MKVRHFYLMGLFGLLLTLFVLMPSGSPWAKDVLRYSCSAQVYQAYEIERLDAFTKKTGIQVEVSTLTSYGAVARLINGRSDVASTARRIYRRHQEAGFEETAFCKDPLAIIVNPKNRVADLSSAQVADIFAGSITNWRLVGGPDKPIVVVLPGHETAASKNFRRKLMGARNMDFDILTSQSTTVIDVVRRFPDSVSFISQGATKLLPKGVKSIRVDGLHPEDPDYPYHQVFTYVTKGVPTGVVKKFINFSLSSEGKEIITKRGMLPYTKLED